MKTPLEGIAKVWLVNQTQDGKNVKSPELTGMKTYWHSRTAFANQHGEMVEVYERIQGQMTDGTWLTITWDGKRYITTKEKKAIGKPIRL